MSGEVAQRSGPRAGAADQRAFMRGAVTLENAVVGGVPARVLRMREAPEQLRWE